VIGAYFNDEICSGSKSLLSLFAVSFTICKFAKFRESPPQSGTFFNKFSQCLMPCPHQRAEWRTEPKSRAFRRACNVRACISANHATSARSFWRSICCRYSGEPSKEVTRACCIKSGRCHVHKIVCCTL
jgi:hypothetical protein